MKKRIKKILEKIRKKNYFFNSIYQRIINWYYAFKYKIISYNNPVDEKIIFFESFIGKQYACSPKAIYEQMLKDPYFKDYTFVWSFRKYKRKKLKKEFTDSRTVLVTYKSKKYYEYCAKAKYWITNWRMPVYMKKKKNQVFIETWHGTPLKKIGLDSTKEGIAQTSQKKTHKMYLKDAKGYDYFISPSHFCTKVFASAFGLDQLKKTNIIIETGYPRNDKLYNYTQDDIYSIKSKLNIPLDKKIILYAPTWRDNQHILGVGNTLDINSTFQNFMNNVSDEYVVILRLHYLVASKVDLTGLENKVYNYSNIDDVNDLYLISDILITDYSSVFFDYANLKRPILFYMYDLEDYQHNIRDFYIDLASLPGPIIKTEEELLKAVYNIDKITEKYQSKYDMFSKTYNYLDDGNASKRVIDICVKNINSDRKE